MELNRVLISDAVDVSCREILEGAGIAVDYKPGMSKTDLLAAIKVFFFFFFFFFFFLYCFADKQTGEAN